MSFRNRSLIAGANGIISLSIPLLDGRDQKMKIRDVRIDNRKKWQSQHWKSIESSYNRSPWFEHYRDGLTTLYGQKTEFLFDWNLRCFEWTLEKLGMDVSTSLTESFSKYPDLSSQIDRRNQILPKNYFLSDPVRYRQVFEERLGFLPNLSILDLLFCEGKNAETLLKK
jgi:hypothetical protein